MKKYKKPILRVSIFLVIINILWMLYNTTQYIDVSTWFVKPESYLKAVSFGLIVIFFSHILIILTVLVNLKKTNSQFISGIVLLILGAVSFISIFFHWGCLSDIYKEYPLGLEVENELKVIWISQIIHFSFLIYSLLFLYHSLKNIKSGQVSNSLFVEQLFISFNVIGIVCGTTGLMIVLPDFYFNVNPQLYKWAIIPYSLFVLIPYLLMISGWIVYVWKYKKSGWYDEKLKGDIYKSGTFTLLTSIPVMLFIFLLNYKNIDGSIAVLWLPFYLFVILLIFSLATLYNYKTN